MRNKKDSVNHRYVPVHIFRCLLFEKTTVSCPVGSHGTVVTVRTKSWRETLVRSTRVDRGTDVHDRGLDGCRLLLFLRVRQSQYISRPSDLCTRTPYKRYIIECGERFYLCLKHTNTGRLHSWIRENETVRGPETCGSSQDDSPSWEKSMMESESGRPGFRLFDRTSLYTVFQPFSTPKISR